MPPLLRVRSPTFGCAAAGGDRLASVPTNVKPSRRGERGRSTAGGRDQFADRQFQQRRAAELHSQNANPGGHNPVLWCDAVQHTGRNLVKTESQSARNSL